MINKTSIWSWKFIGPSIPICQCQDQFENNNQLLIYMYIGIHECITWMVYYQFSISLVRWSSTNRIMGRLTSLFNTDTHVHMTSQTELQCTYSIDHKTVVNLRISRLALACFFMHFGWRVSTKSLQRFFVMKWTVLSTLQFCLAGLVWQNDPGIFTSCTGFPLHGESYWDTTITASSS